MGFSTVAEFANADEDGRVWITQFRKAVTSTATITSSWTDYTYFAGSPLANFYASTPLESAYVDSARGIYVPSVAPLSQYLKGITVMSAAASATSTANQRQTLLVCDYLMYYPFVDTDSTDQQDLIQAVTLPRYTSGRVMAIAQSASSTIGQFTMSYTNQDGVASQVSPNCFTQIVAGGGQSLAAVISGGGFQPFIPLAAGDTGVRSIESVTFTAVGGGLMALVIVAPIFSFDCATGCRRTTSGNLESYGAASGRDALIHGASVPEIKDGAVLGIYTCCGGGSLASSILVGTLETIWN